MIVKIIEIFSGLLGSITLASFLIGVVIFIITFLLSLGIVALVLVKLPVTYFRTNHPREFWTERHPGIRFAGVLAKNFLGTLLEGLGIVMAIPGVPGQGLLTILLGIMLLDFPGKRRLELKLVSRPKVFQAINRLRHRFGKPGLVLD
jgi:hypothetical protein